jgi:hypothetical protein
MNFLGAGLEIAGAAKFMSALQERKGVGKKAPTLVCQNSGETRPAALAIQLDTELTLQRNESVPDSLFGDAKGLRGRTDLAAPRQFHKCGDLVRTEVGQAGHGCQRYKYFDYGFNN